MGLGLAGAGYALLYAVLVTALASHPVARLWAGNIGLLLPPLVTIAVIARRRHDWSGRQLVFWGAVAAGAAMWLAGQVAWAFHELLQDRQLPWLDWDVVPQLSGSMMPLIALVAAPHRGPRRDSAATTALDISGVALLSAYLYWMLIVAPGSADAGSQLAVRVLATVGPAIRLAVVLGLLIAIQAAGASPWRIAYRRLALGAAVSFVMLVLLSSTVFAEQYQTGTPLDAGWILPFFLYAWAADTAPASEPETADAVAASSRGRAPLVLFAAVAMVPIVRSITRHLMPLPPAVDHYREIATETAVLAGLALAMIRVIVEQRSSARADERVRLLAAAAQQTSELIVIVRDTAIEYANEAFCQAVGYDRRSLEALPARALVAPESAGAIADMRAALLRGEQVRTHTTLRRRDGSTFEAALSAAPLFDQGQATHFVGVVRDLTEEIGVRDRLVRSERLSAAGELVSSIAHEINNPLQSVVGSVDVLLKRSSDESLRADLERVRREAWRAGRIVRNLLTFVRKTPRERLLGELNEIVQAAMTLCRYDLEASRVAVREELSPQLPLVLVNREEIQQIVLNLVTNAQQSLMEAGRGGALTIRTYATGTDAVLEVADDGPGVPAEVAARIFEPFNTTKDTGQANGFGLSTAFGIAVAHGGTLELVGAARGAVFRLTLPGAGFAGPVVHSA